MHPNKGKKLVQTLLEVTLLLTVLNVLTPSVYATEWSSMPDTRLTWDKSRDWAPSMAQAQDGRIWVVWHSSRIGTYPDIMYKVYNGSSTFPWSPAKKLTTDSSVKDMTPSIITTADGNIWVVWSSDRDENFEIYYKIYNGSSWSSDTRLTEDASVDESPSIMQDKDGDIWVVWSSDRTGNFEIHYKVYDNQTKEWQPQSQLTSNPSPDADPSITQDQDEKIWIVWERNEDLYHTVFFKNMTVWMPITPLTMDSHIHWHPSIMQAQNGAIWIAWATNMTFGTDDMDIYCRKIHNFSVSDERITYADADDQMPAIMQAADGTIWIAWTSNRINNIDIYYKTDSPPPHDHDIALVSVTHNPNTTYVNKGLNISIEVVPQNQGAESEDFEVRCYANSTLIGNKTIGLSAGQLMPIGFIWETSGVASGTYTITAEVSILGETDTDPADNSLADGTVLVAIKGDADGDGKVDASDLFSLSQAYGSGLGGVHWNPNCDFNGDSKVEVLDLFDLSKNYGETG